MEKSMLNKYLDLYKADLFDAVIPFWYNFGLDLKYGGIDSCLTRDGKVYSAEKSVWMQGRAGWMFSYICREIQDDPRLREMAKSAITFAKAKCIDPKDGRMYFLVGTDGIPIRKRRYNASEKNYIKANAEYYGLTGDREYLVEARKYYDFVIEITRDPSKDPFKITPKFEPGQPATRGLCASFVLLGLAATMRRNDPERADLYRKEEVLQFNSIMKYQWNEKLGILLETVGMNGEYLNALSSGRTIIPGHCFEAIWTLIDAAEEFGNINECLPQIERFYEGAYKYGWDKEYGGFLYFLDADGYPPQAYEHDMKLWWVHTEGIIAALKLYRLTRKTKYWDDYVRLHDYCFENFRDPVYGEWYGYLRRDGKPTLPVCKGNAFKGPLHVPRMYTFAILELQKILSIKD